MIKLALALSAALMALASASADSYGRTRHTRATNFDDCRRVKFTGNNCAVIFDESDCEGWSVHLNTGYTDLPDVKDNEAESVVVRPGCTFKGKWTFF